jgi:hypothetical protein
LLSYINTINKEIARKRAEFGLEILSDGSTEYKDLLTKRLTQVGQLVEYVRDNGAYSKDYDALMNEVERALRSDDKAALDEVAAKVRALYKTLDADGAIYAADKIDVMGYDMNDTTLTKDQKRKARKCYSYEVYKNTSKLETQLYCMADFLEDCAFYTQD